jgi:hypothetical protein
LFAEKGRGARTAPQRKENAIHVVFHALEGSGNSAHRSRHMPLRFA